MLTHDELADLHRELLNVRTLSIYLEGWGDNPGERTLWRKQLAREIEGARSRLEDASRSEKGAFEDAVARLMEKIGAFGAFVPGEGWVGFATPDKVWYAEPVPVPVPTLVRWEDGIRVAPYLRGLKQDRVVVTALLDSRRAQVFEYRDGQLGKPRSLRADTFVGDLTDANISKRAATHSGIRGETATDTAQCAMEVTTERLRKHVVEVLADLVGGRGLLIVGGTPEMVSGVARSVPNRLEGRVAERPALHLGMSTAEVKQGVEAAMSELNQKLQSRSVDQIVDRAHAGGLACLGQYRTERALAERRVDALVLSRSFIERNPDVADRLASSAFGQRADVEEVSDKAGDRLLAKGEGIGARLRYQRPSGTGTSRRRALV